MVLHSPACSSPCLVLCWNLGDPWAWVSRGMRVCEAPVGVRQRLVVMALVGMLHAVQQHPDFRLHMDYSGAAQQSSSQHLALQQSCP